MSFFVIKKCKLKDLLKQKGLKVKENIIAHNNNESEQRLTTPGPGSC